MVRHFQVQLAGAIVNINIVGFFNNNLFYGVISFLADEEKFAEEAQMKYRHSS